MLSTLTLLKCLPRYAAALTPMRPTIQLYLVAFQTTEKQMLGVVRRCQNGTAVRRNGILIRASVMQSAGFQRTQRSHDDLEVTHVTHTKATRQGTPARKRSKAAEGIVSLRKLCIARGRRRRWTLVPRPGRSSEHIRNSKHAATPCGYGSIVDLLDRRRCMVTQDATSRLLQPTTWLPFVQVSEGENNRYLRSQLQA